MRRMIYVLTMALIMTALIVASAAAAVAAPRRTLVKVFAQPTTQHQSFHRDI